MCDQILNCDYYDFRVVNIIGSHTITSVATKLSNAFYGISRIKWLQNTHIFWGILRGLWREGNHILEFSDSNYFPHT